jgi:hypothetical protein
MTNTITNEIVEKAKALPPHEKLRLIEHLVPGLDAALRTSPATRQRGLREILLEEIRRDIFRATPRREFFCPARPSA